MTAILLKIRVYDRAMYKCLQELGGTVPYPKEQLWGIGTALSLFFWRSYKGSSSMSLRTTLTVSVLAVVVNLGLFAATSLEKNLNTPAIRMLHASYDCLKRAMVQGAFQTLFQRLSLHYPRLSATAFEVKGLSCPVSSLLAMGAASAFFTGLMCVCKKEASWYLTAMVMNTQMLLDAPIYHFYGAQGYLLARISWLMYDRRFTATLKNKP